MRPPLCGVVALALVACGGDANTPEAPDGTIALANGPLAVTTLEDTPVVFFAVRTPSVTTEPAHGTTSVDGTEITYTPAKDYDGDDTLSIAFSNGSTNSVAAITVTMTPVNDPPIAHDVTYDLSATPLTIAAATGLVAHVTDVDSTSFTVELATPPDSGTVTVNADGSFVYALADTSAPSFTYTATDDSDAVSAPGTVSFRLIPLAVDDAYDATRDVALHVTAANGVLANDTSIAGQALGCSLVTGPEHGQLSLGSDGSFTYTATSDTAISDSFTYLAAQSDGASRPSDRHLYDCTVTDNQNGDGLLKTMIKPAILPSRTVK